MIHYDAAKLWLTKASRDLQSAKILIDIEDPDIDLVAFLSQQCAEKSLKGFLTYHGQRIRKTHDLKDLSMSALNIETKLGAELRKTSLLTPYAVKARYPDADIEITREIAIEAIGIAERMHNFLLEFIETNESL